MPNNLRALPTLLKIGFAEAVAYRAEFLAVEALDSGGAWRKLNTRWRPYVGFEIVSPEANGNALAKAETRLLADGNEGIAYANPIRLRVVMQSNDRLSSEDGAHVGTAGGVVLDNLRVLQGSTDVIPPTDFEDGTTGAWSREALNGAYQVGPLSTGTSTPTRTLATLPATNVALSAGTHPSRPASRHPGSPGPQACPRRLHVPCAPWSCAGAGEPG